MNNKGNKEQAAGRNPARIIGYFSQTISIHLLVNASKREISSLCLQKVKSLHFLIDIFQNSQVKM